MTATRSDIERWIDERPEGCTHLIVVCDTYDWDDYPVYYPSDSTKAAGDVEECARNFDGKSMQQVMEIYSFTGKHTIEAQLTEHRARHVD